MRKSIYVSLTAVLVGMAFCCSAQTRTDSLPVSAKWDSLTLRPIAVQVREGSEELLFSAKQNVNNTAKTIVSSALPKVPILKTGQPFHINDFQLELGATKGINPNSVAPNASFDWSSSYRFQNTISVLSIPFSFSIRGANGYYFMQRSPFENFYKLNFDPRKYKELLQAQVLEKIDPNVLAASVVKRLDEIKTGYEKKLVSEIFAIKQQFEKDYSQNLDIPASLGDLSHSDFSTLKAALYQRANQFSDSLLQRNGPDISGMVQDSSMMHQELLHDRKIDALNKIFHRFVYYKQLFEENKLVNELRSQLPMTAGSFSSYLAKPAHLSHAIKEGGSLSSIQNLFLHLTQLNIGQNAVNNGEFSLHNVINSGVSTGFTNSKSSVDVIYGKGANGNQWLQRGLTSFTTNEYSSLSGLKFSSATSDRFRQTISINFFNFETAASDFEKQQLNQSYYYPLPQHKDAVITLQSEYLLSGEDRFGVNVSKSFGSYSQITSVPSQTAKESSFSSLFGNKGQSNLAFSANYSKKILGNLVQFNFKKIGLGYSNPGNISLRQGATEMGFSTEGKYLRNKLRFGLSSWYRNQHFDPLKKYTYRTFSNKLQSDFRWKKNNHVGLTWQQNDYLSAAPSSSHNAGSSNRFELNSSYSFFLYGKKVQNASMISNQKLILPVLTGGNYKSTNLMLTHNSSMILGNNLLAITIMRNASSNKDYYFNTSFTSSEVHYSYKTLGSLQLTNSLGYYQNQGWNKQIGAQQQISGVLLKKIDFDLQFNYKKAIQITRSEMANEVYVSSSLYYHFN